MISVDDALSLRPRARAFPYYDKVREAEFRGDVPDPCLTRIKSKELHAPSCGRRTPLKLGVSTLKRRAYGPTLLLMPAVYSSASTALSAASFVPGSSDAWDALHDAVRYGVFLHTDSRTGVGAEAYAWAGIADFAPGLLLPGGVGEDAPRLLARCAAGVRKILAPRLRRLKFPDV